MPPGGNLASIAAQPQFPALTRPKYAAAVGKTIDGTFQSAEFAGPMDCFDLVYENQSEAQIASLRTFYDDNKGPIYGFTWTNPLTGITHNVRFDPDEPIEFVKLSPNKNSARVVLLYRKV